MPLVKILNENGKQIVSDLEKLCGEELKCSNRMRNLIISKFNNLIIENDKLKNDDKK